jgi:hypothetical protein
MTRPSPKAQKRRTLVKLLVNTMNQYEDGSTFDTLAEGVADVLMDTVFFEADNSKLFWDQFYSLKNANKRLKLENNHLKKKNKRLTVLNNRLQERCLRMREEANT